MKLLERLDLAPAYVRAAFQPDTFDAESRTVEVVWTTGAEVSRSDWERGRHIEALSLDSKHVRLDRLNAGAALLDNHNAWGGVRSVLGVVERAWLAKGEGRATLRFSEREDVQDVVRDVQAGILRHVSVGYRVHKFRDDTEKDANVKRFTAIDWEPFELSLVTIPADAKAGVRSEQRGDLYPCEVFREETTMPQDTFGAGVDGETRQAADQATPPAQTPVASAPVTPPVDLDAERATAATQARADERARITEIEDHCRSFGLPESEIRTLVETGEPLSGLTSQVRSAYTAMHQANDAGEIRSTIQVGEEDLSKRRSAATEALAARLQPTNQSNTDLGDFRGRSMLDMVRLLEEGRGGDALRMSREDLVKRAFHATADFPVLLQEAARRTLRRRYELAEQTWAKLVTQGTLPDFRPMDRAKIGDAPEMEEMPENADVKFGTTSESKETVQLTSYSAGISLGRRSIINDDLGAFGRLVESQAQRVSDLVANLAYAQLIGGTLTAGGIYAAGNKNTTSGGASALTADASGVAALGKLEATMLLQKSDGGMRLNLRPKYLVVPVALKVAAEQLTAEISPKAAEDVNPFRGRLEVITDARLDDDSLTKWYLVADPARIDTIEVNWLEGNVGPQFDMEECFENRGVKYAVFADVSAKSIDYRGLSRAAGA